MFHLAAVLCAVLAVTTAHHEAVHDLAESNIAFSQKLYKILSKPEGNFIFSPLALQTVLSLVYSGAGGKTAQQLADGLSLNQKELARMPEGFQEALNVFKKYEPDLAVQVATALFAQSGLPVQEKFRSTALGSFLAEVQAENFKDNAKAAETNINQWVADHTNNSIRDILTPGSVDARTRLVLVNALRFSGVWKVGFDPQSTASVEFHTAPGQSKKVPMLRETLPAQLADLSEQDATVVSLPYKGEKVRLLLVVPKKDHGLKQVESKLSSIDFEHIDRRLEDERIYLQMPKFKIQQNQKLKETLKQIGIVDIFDDDKANLEGVSTTKLKVDDVAHAATITVDENGTEASAAASVQLIQPVSGVDTLIINQPFVFALQDIFSKTLLFMGRFSTPE